MTTEHFESDIRREEGLRLSAYRDTEGVLTIGYGHTGADVAEGMRWGIEHAKEVFAADVRRAVAALDLEAVWWRNLNGPRQDVIGSMAFQLGLRGVLNFHRMVAAIRRGDFESAAEEMLSSKWAKQTPHRAARLAEQMKTGERNDD